MSDLVMPFGKFKGVFIHKLPSSYLYWLAVNCDWNTTIQEAADEEYQYREKYGGHYEDEP